MRGRSFDDSWGAMKNTIFIQKKYSIDLISLSLPWNKIDFMDSWDSQFTPRVKKIGALGPVAEEVQIL